MGASKDVHNFEKFHAYVKDTLIYINLCGFTRKNNRNFAYLRYESQLVTGLVPNGNQFCLGLSQASHRQSI